MGRWICVDWTTGKTMWITRWYNKGSIIAAEGLLYIYEERWTGEGSTNDGIRAFSAETVGDNNRASDYWVYDGSYVRLKQLSIGYTIPNKISSKALIQKFRVYFSASNVLTFTKYPGNDPEVGGNNDANSIGVDFSMYPSPKSYIVGVNLVF